VGEHDEFCKTLKDETLVIGQEGLRVCAVCDKIRVSHVQPCTYCTAQDRKRVSLTVAVLLFVVVIAFGLAALVGSYKQHSANSTLDTETGEHWTTHDDSQTQEVQP